MPKLKNKISNFFRGERGGGAGNRQPGAFLWPPPASVSLLCWYDLTTFRRQFEPYLLLKLGLKSWKDQQRLKQLCCGTHQGAPATAHKRGMCYSARKHIRVIQRGGRWKDTDIIWAA